MIAEPTRIPEQTRLRMEQIGNVDIVIGLADPRASENLAPLVQAVQQGLAGLAQPPGRAVVAFREADSASETSGDDSLRLLPFQLVSSDAGDTPTQVVASAYRAIWNISESLGARACCVLVSSGESMTADWIRDFVRPVLEQDFDLVAPCYAQRKLDGLLNAAILHPLTRAVYGKEIHNPLGPDFCFSGRFISRLLPLDAVRARQAPAQIMLVGPEAAILGVKLCQVQVGARSYGSPDWKGVSSILADILGPLFLGMERNAAFWQRSRTTEQVPTFGHPISVQDDTPALDARRLMESFQFGSRNLQEIWRVVLPPASLFELNKLDRQPPEHFRMPDDLWARVIYDFALAYRLRTIGRDHLVRAMTPLYLGWVASYALAVDNLDAATAARRAESISTGFETQKPYLVSRWRWPDRFNP